MPLRILHQGRPRRPRLADQGFTLLEVIVVLVVIGLLVGLVAPSLVVPTPTEESQMAGVLRGARDLSARRGELLQLRMSPTGVWRLETVTGLSEEALASGTLERFNGPAFTLMVAPLGTCAFDARSTTAARSLPLDPLTCELGTDVGTARP